MKLNAVLWSIVLSVSLSPMFQSGSALAREESLLDRAFPSDATSKTEKKTWGRDPFESMLRKKSTSPAIDGESRRGSLSLTAVISRDGNGMAIINHQVVRMGDRISGMQVTAIGQNTVTLQDSSGAVELRLNPFTTDVGGNDRKPD